MLFSRSLGSYLILFSLIYSAIRNLGVYGEMEIAAKD